MEISVPTLPSDRPCKFEDVMDIDSFVPSENEMNRKLLELYNIRNILRTMVNHSIVGSKNI